MKIENQSLFKELYGYKYIGYLVMMIFVFFFFCCKLYYIIGSQTVPEFILNFYRTNKTEFNVWFEYCWYYSWCISLPEFYWSCVFQFNLFKEILQYTHINYFTFKFYYTLLQCLRLGVKVIMPLHVSIQVPDISSKHITMNKLIL